MNNKDTTLTNHDALIDIKPIEYDAEVDRFYIPVNSRYEIQTKGKGSSFRIANKVTHLRNIVLNDSLHHVLEDMAKATNAEMMQLKAATKASEKRIRDLEYLIDLDTELHENSAKTILELQAHVNQLREELEKTLTSLEEKEEKYEIQK